ncbi:phosphotransferase family protein [Allokutzneria sp. A3M-2-11 16]|uniref:phosphotransferase family protein n=1 Tax=Allokutzneria sp. A3M-2-11 16 TaxID=2962043 RepID=UPI0020B8FF13|nr:phosphotransferase [Allokutzneria sp. A3M-2-11 16]MCP3804447.1 phosphotransferase family protein [Allokutzneria sp. A3M-2-11 16]
MNPLPGLDLAAAEAYLHRERPGLLTGPLTAELIAGGRSNLTYLLTDAGGTEWVLRRPPLGHVLATAHDMAREYRVISALGATPVPVPRAELLCTDPEVLGAPFYLMERAPGTVLRRRKQADVLGEDGARRLSEQLVDVLVDLHSVDPAAVGLGDFGRPEGFMARQLARWRKQLDASRSRPVPELDELSERLGADVPDSGRAAIVHGDYRLDNVLVAMDPVRVSAVLDWEMATLGDPLADLGLLVVYWDRLTGIGDAIADSFAGMPGFPSSAELVARYTARTGVDPAELPWYVAFGHFKLGVIVEGIHYRHTQGKTVGAGFELLGQMVGPLAKGGIAALEGEL